MKIKLRPDTYYVADRLALEFTDYLLEGPFDTFKEAEVQRVRYCFSDDCDVLVTVTTAEGRCKFEVVV
jgi:hypothetical protein